MTEESSYLTSTHPIPSVLGTGSKSTFHTGRSLYVCTISKHRIPNDFPTWPPPEQRKLNSPHIYSLTLEILNALLSSRKSGGHLSTSPSCTTLQEIMRLHCRSCQFHLAYKYNTMHCTALQYTTLHHTTPHYTPKSHDEVIQLTNCKVFNPTLAFSFIETALWKQVAVAKPSTPPSVSTIRNEDDVCGDSLCTFLPAKQIWILCNV